MSKLSRTKLHLCDCAIQPHSQSLDRKSQTALCGAQEALIHMQVSEVDVKAILSKTEELARAELAGASIQDGAFKTAAFQGVDCRAALLRIAFAAILHAVSKGADPEDDWKFFQAIHVIEEAADALAARCLCCAAADDQRGPDDAVDPATAPPTVDVSDEVNAFVRRVLRAPPRSKTVTLSVFDVFLCLYHLADKGMISVNERVRNHLHKLVLKAAMLVPEVGMDETTSRVARKYTCVFALYHILAICAGTLILLLLAAASPSLRGGAVTHISPALLNRVNATNGSLCEIAEHLRAEQLGFNVSRIEPLDVVLMRWSSVFMFKEVEAASLARLASCCASALKESATECETTTTFPSNSSAIVSWIAAASRWGKSYHTILIRADHAGGRVGGSSTVFVPDVAVAELIGLCMCLGAIVPAIFMTYASTSVSHNFARRFCVEIMRLAAASHVVGVSLHDVAGLFVPLCVTATIGTSCLWWAHRWQRSVTSIARPCAGLLCVVGFLAVRACAFDQPHGTATRSHLSEMQDGFLRALYLRHAAFMLVASASGVTTALGSRGCSSSVPWKSAVLVTLALLGLTDSAALDGGYPRPEVTFMNYVANDIARAVVVVMTTALGAATAIYLMKPSPGRLAEARMMSRSWVVLALLDFVSDPQAAALALFGGATLIGWPSASDESAPRELEVCCSTAVEQLDDVAAAKSPTVFCQG